MVRQEGAVGKPLAYIHRYEWLGTFHDGHCGLEKAAVAPRLPAGRIRVRLPYLEWRPTYIVLGMITAVFVLTPSTISYVPPTVLPFFVNGCYIVAVTLQ